VKKRRLRKKRRLGEFREDIFRIRIKLKASLLRNEAEDWDWDILIPQVEKLHLGVGGGSRWRPDGVVCNFHVQSRFGSVTKEQRQDLLDWLSKRPEVESVDATGLIDGWWPGKEHDEWDKKHEGDYE